MIYVGFCILILTFFVCIVPIGQLIYSRMTSPKKQTVFYFDEDLFEYDTDNLKFESVDSFQNRINNRNLISSRGSVRQANGNVFDAKSFEEAKAEVYGIQLP